MSGSSDFSSLRASIISHGTSTPVTVNQRHLIDKILARYSSAGAIYRELLQNSNDAGASHAEIHFTLQEKGGTVQELRYRNNGKVFSESDWARLGRIAEGNPDENKVGAFGVGFYSVFSISETPMVVSGGQAMVFGFVGDGLVLTRSKVDEKECGKWTEFALPAREPFPVPGLRKFAAFLANALTFTESLMNVSVFFDGIRQLTILKTLGETIKSWIPVTNSLFRTNVSLSSQSIFSILTRDSQPAITETPITVTVDFPVNNRAIFTQSRIISAEVSAAPSEKLSRGIFRVMKKFPQKRFQLRLMLSDSQVDSDARNDDGSSILSSFSPDPGQGCVYIGFPTRQTTGFGCHVACPIFPAVDRDGVDLSSGQAIATWNRELLYTAGIALRVILESSLTRISEEYLRETKNNAASEPEPEPAPSSRSSMKRLFNMLTATFYGQKDPLLNPQEPKLSSSERHTLTLMKACSPHRSTPSSEVRDLILNGMLQSMPRHEIPVLTTTGISREPLVASQGIEQFCINLPIVRRKVSEHISEYMQLNSRIRPISVRDLAGDLRGRPVDIEVAAKLINWWVAYAEANEIVQDSEEGKLLRDAIVVKLNGRSQQLANFRFYRGQELDKDLPLPESCLPECLREKIDPTALSESFFAELTPIHWSGWAARHQALTTLDSSIRKELFLAVMRSVNDAEAQDAHRASALSTLRDRPCVENVSGTLGLPSECYLSDPSILLFRATAAQVISPWIASSVPASLLKELGVLDHVGIDVLFSSLDSLKWTSDVSPLLQYLLTVEDKLSDEEWKQLREARYLPSTSGGLHAPSELVLPLSESQITPGGNKVVKWKGKRGSDQERCLLKLGVRERLPLNEILHDGIAASAATIRAIASDAKYLEEVRGTKCRFLPCSVNGQSVVCRITDCFASERWNVLRLPVVTSEVRKESLLFGVREDPLVRNAVVSLLKVISELREDVSTDHQQHVRKIFDVMGSLSGGLSDKRVRETLMNAPIVPVSGAWYRPADVYFENTALFPCAPECAFLRALGVRDFPTPSAIAAQILQDPLDAFRRIGEEEYLNMLRTIAGRFDDVEDRLKSLMRRRPWLLGCRRRGGKVSRRLMKVNDIVLIDNPLLEMQFDRCWGCPLESGLESMYRSLGCIGLNSAVRKERKTHGDGEDTELAASVRARILERRGILLDREVVYGADQLLGIEMEVKQVAKISMRLEFRGEFQERETCCALRRSRKRLKLEISDPLDFFEVAEALAELLLRRFKLEDRFYIGMILEMSVEQLRAKGLLVDRLVNTVPSKPTRGYVPAERASSPTAVKQTQVNALKPNREERLAYVSPKFNRHSESGGEKLFVPGQRPTPRLERESQHTEVSRRSKRDRQKKGFLQRALKNLGSSASFAHPSVKSLSQTQGGRSNEINLQASETSVVPDFEAQSRTRGALKEAIRSCSEVSSKGLQSTTHVLNPSKEDDVISKCEVIPGQDLIAFSGQNGNEKHSIRVFFARRDPRAANYLARHWAVVERFRVVLTLLASVFGLSLTSCAIFYDPSGKTIAFNSNRALYFNVRFFINLHGGGGGDTLRNPEVYVYWYLIWAHELAHLFESAHNQVHEHYMSAFADQYFVPFIAALSTAGVRIPGGSTSG